ncbi:MAG TPA: menaquinone biosynthesis decarboxylase [Bacteroidales bacterium]|nr:menaquinone biosynthesis decarboxylase [Bacteroidales bacterium]
MAFHSLSEIIDLLCKRSLVAEVGEEVSPILEASEIADRFASDEKSGRPLLFLQNGTAFPLLMNLFANKEITDELLNLTGTEGYFSRLQNLLSMMDSKPRLSRKSMKSIMSLRKTSPKKMHRKGACMAVVQPAPDFNLLPVIQCWPYDGGRFLTLPLVHTIDPDTGKQNTGMYRMQVFDGQSTGMHWHRHKGGAAHFEAWKKKGKRMPVTVTLGGDPVLTYVATAPLPEGISEYMLAGFLKNKRVPLVKSHNSDIWIPECSDFVIEGYIDPVEPLRTEGPFGDHTGFYSLPDEYPVFHITRISHRKNAVYPATLVGVPPKEDQFLGHATSQIFFPLIQKIFAPEILDLYLPVEGGFHNLALVKIRKKFPGQAVKVMHALWGAGQMMFTKVIMVFSEEVDIRNPQSVLDAIDANFSPVHDLHLSADPYDVLDHAAQSFSHGGKAGFDCTTKTEERKSETIADNYATIDSVRSFSKSVHVIFSDHAVAESGNLFLNLAGGAAPVQKGIYIITDTRMKEAPDDILLWYVLAAIDPARDFSLIRSLPAGGVLVINACVYGKRAVPGGHWPAATVMSEDIINLVNEKWNSYGVGDFIESPSKRLSALKSDSFLNR